MKRKLCRVGLWSVVLGFLGAASYGVPAFAISLKEAVRLAVTENPTGQADSANRRAVAAELIQSQTSFRPTVDVFGDVGYQKRESPTSTSVSSGGNDVLLSRQIGVEASLLLFDGFERANIVYRNAARLDAATFRLLSTSESLAVAAVEAYVDVVRHRHLLSEAQTNIARHREILFQIRERVRGGKAPASDRIQIEERVFAAEAVTVEVQLALADAEAKFYKVVGRNPSGSMRVPWLKNLPRSRHELIDRSLTNNYSIKQAEKSVNEVEFGREAAMAATKPRLSLDGRASAGSDRTGTPGNESDLYVGLTLSWRLYDGGLRQARERTLAERIGEAELRRDIAVRDVRELSVKTWNAYHKGAQRNALLREQVRSNNTIVNSYREEYELAKRSLLDVLDAERARFNAKFQQISVEATVLFSAYRMLAAMSELASHFGISSSSLAPAPDAVEAIMGSPHKIFDVTIEPLQ